MGCGRSKGSGGGRGVLVLFVLGTLLTLPRTSVAAPPLSACAARVPAGLKVETRRDPQTGQCTGFSIKKGRKKLADVHRGFSGSGTLLVSQDGLRAVFVANHFFGRLRVDGQLVAKVPHHDDIPFMNDGLVFFFKGKKTASYTLEALIERPQLVHVGKDHVTWLAAENPFLTQPLGDTLRLTTTSFRALRFDTRSGVWLSATNTATWSRCAHMAFGEVALDGQARLDPAFPIRGRLGDHFDFQIPAWRPVTTGYQTLCFERRQNAWWVTRVLAPLNGAAIAPKADSEVRFRCASDADCVLGARGSAVSAAWSEGREASNASGGDAPCATLSPRAACRSQSCVTLDSAGRLDRACTRKR